MKQIKLYLSDDFKDILQDWEEVKPFKILSVADDIDLWESAISLGNKIYGVASSQGDSYKIYELPNFNIEEDTTYGEDEIKCPICGNEISDSWEYEGEDGEEICPGCGATLEWTREVEVTYSTSVKKVVKPLKL